MNEPVNVTGLTTTTSTYLLRALMEPGNQSAWRDYAGRYRPMLVRYARRVGIDAADAEDVAQQTLAAFSRAYQEGKYDRDRGRLRDWLFGIARNEIRSWRRQQDRLQPPRPAPGGRAELIEHVADADDTQLEAAWESEWRNAMFQHCLDQIRTEVEPTTVLAFEQFALQLRPAVQIAEELGVTENAIYGAKRRVLRRMRELMGQAERDW